MDKDDLGMGSRGGHSGIPVHFSSATARALGHSESLAGVDSSPGFRALPRVGLPLPCQTFPACRNGGRQTLELVNLKTKSSHLEKQWVHMVHFSTASDEQDASSACENDITQSCYYLKKKS